MPAKNVEKIQEIVDAMTVPGIIGTGTSNKITGNQIADTISNIPRKTSIKTVHSTNSITFTAERGYYPNDVSSALTKYIGVSTIIPSAGAITLRTQNKYVPANFTIRGDANLIPANIRSGVTIFGVTGTFVDAANYISGVVNMKQGDALYYTDYSNGYGRLITTTANNGPLSSTIRVRQESFVVLMCWGSAALPVTNGVTNVFTGQLQNYYTWNAVCIYHAYNNGFIIDHQ